MIINFGHVIKKKGTSNGNGFDFCHSIVTPVPIFCSSSTSSFRLFYSVSGFLHLIGERTQKHLSISVATARLVIFCLRNDENDAHLGYYFHMNESREIAQFLSTSLIFR